MKISKYVLMHSYGVTLNHFFETRNDRNAYFANYPKELSEAGVLCAIGANVNLVADNDEVWDLERYNGTNWTVQSVDPNYSLIITNEGIAALANINNGTYHLDITAIKVKQNHIVNPTKPLMAWTKEDFEADGDIILDSNTNLNFNLDTNLRWRTNLANGGIQYTVLIETDTYGEINGVRYDEYTIGALGLYIDDPNEPNRKVLFAIGNLNSNIPKYTTTPERVGNAIKLLLNTVISNLGYVSDLTLFKESVNSVPEVENEVKLVENYGTTISPYNFYLINNYSGTNLPALAVRRGDPSREKVTWQYFTPSTDVLTVEDNQIDSNLFDYMVATWDNEARKFVRATARYGSLPTNNVTGIKIGNHIVHSGNVSCFNIDSSFEISISNNGYAYNVGDLLVYENPSPHIEFKIRVKSVSVTGAIEDFALVSVTGSGTIEAIGVSFGYDSSTASGGATGKDFVVNITSVNAPDRTYIWDFPGGEEVGDKVNWYNRPLYADKDWSGASQSEWEAYCAEVGLSPTDEPKDRRGKLTIKESDFFVGWCTGVATNSSIRLMMDLEDQASETDYGTTRYASDDEVREKTSGISTVTSVTPQTAFDNYLQRSKPATGKGSSWDNRIDVNSYVQFNTTVVGKNASGSVTSTIMNDPNISFFGTAYRALWGDLAEYYRSDKIYPAGTLITMGCGAAEITKAITECNGIVSTRPGYELGEKKDQKDLPVALVGKVPVIFESKCRPRFGDRIYLSQTEPGKASTTPYGKCLGKIIDKGEDLGSQGTILCSVRISF